MIKRTLSVIAMVTMMGSAGNVAADDRGVLRDLVSRLEALELQAAPLKALQSKVAVLEAALAAKQDAMDCLYQIGTELYVDGCNLHVRNGLGESSSLLPSDHAPWESSSLDPTNGLGNLIVGYNEDSPYYLSEKTGSHNVVVGPYHHYTDLNGLVTGSFNRIAGKDSAVTGGQSNHAGGYGSSVSGGKNNTASGYGSSVSGGDMNWADGPYSSVSGGTLNTAKGNWASINGGVSYIADEDLETLP